MADTTNMPELAYENASLIVHGLHNRLPGFHLLLRVNARGVWVSV